MKIELLEHASIRLSDDMVIYIDPYDIKEKLNDADYIFITHDHYDHYDTESIDNISKEDTKIILPKCLEKRKHDLLVEPNNHYKIDNISFDTIPSYNTDKQYHPKEKEYVGYNILLNDCYYYIMGDTDRTPEADKVKTDVCFVPIGGTFTMNAEEAADYINYLKPKKTVPIHYGKIIGEKSLGTKFKNMIDDNIEVEVLINDW